MSGCQNTESFRIAMLRQGDQVCLFNR